MTFAALFNTFAQNLLPILLIGSAGFLIGRTLSIDPRTLGRIAFYFFIPLLVFNLILKSDLNFQTALVTMGYATATIVLVGCVAFLFGKLLRLERPLLLAVLLTTAFGNTGNYGLPLVKLAFGDDALAYASLYFVATTILYNTAGVVIVSLGHTNLKTATLGLLKTPTIYGFALAGLLNFLDVNLPTALTNSIELAASGAIPLMLVLLGIELSRVEWSHSFRALGLATFVKLIVSPIVGLALAALFGFAGEARQGAATQTGMPAAVVTSVLASEYRLEPSLVTAIVFVGTVLSPLTLTPLLVYLGR